MDFKLTEQPSPESGDQWHEVQLPVTSSVTQGPIWSSVLSEIFIDLPIDLFNFLPIDYGQDCDLSKFDTNEEVVVDMPEGCGVFQRGMDRLEI